MARGAGGRPARCRWSCAARSAGAAGRGRRAARPPAGASPGRHSPTPTPPYAAAPPATSIRALRAPRAPQVARGEVCRRRHGRRHKVAAVFSVRLGHARQQLGGVAQHRRRQPRRAAGAGERLLVRPQVGRRPRAGAAQRARAAARRGAHEVRCGVWGGGHPAWTRIWGGGAAPRSEAPLPAARRLPLAAFLKATRPRPSPRHAPARIAGGPAPPGRPPGARPLSALPRAHAAPAKRKTRERTTAPNRKTARTRRRARVAVVYHNAIPLGRRVARPRVGGREAALRHQRGVF